jgi:ribosomal protein L16 Arg81 hydroxylase
MPKVSKQNAKHDDYGPVESWHEEVDEQAIEFVTFTVDGEDEVMEPGDAFYIPPGHLQRAEAGTEYLQFSPAKEMAEVEQQIMKNMQQMQGT